MSREREQVARLFWPEPFECDTMPAGKKMALDAADRILAEIIAPLTAERDRLRTERDLYLRASSDTNALLVAAEALLAEAREVLEPVANRQMGYPYITAEHSRRARSLLARLAPKEPT